MKLLDYTGEDLCVASLRAPDRDGCLKVLAERFVGAEKIRDSRELLKALVDRENVESTGIGRGIALPHARCESFRGHAVAMAHLSPPLDFGSADGEPVDLVFLLAGSRSFPGTQLRILARISQLVRVESFLASLREASTPAAMLDCLREAEEAVI